MYSLYLQTRRGVVCSSQNETSRPRHEFLFDEGGKSSVEETLNSIPVSCENDA